MWCVADPAFSVLRHQGWVVWRHDDQWGRATGVRPLGLLRRSGGARPPGRGTCGSRPRASWKSSGKVAHRVPGTSGWGECLAAQGVAGPADEFAGYRQCVPVAAAPLLDLLVVGVVGAPRRAAHVAASNRAQAQQRWPLPGEAAGAALVCGEAGGRGGRGVTRVTRLHRTQGTPHAPFGRNHVRVTEALGNCAHRTVTRCF